VGVGVGVGVGSQGGHIKGTTGNGVGVYPVVK
jgi:hypothetical protein